MLLGGMGGARGGCDGARGGGNDDDDHDARRVEGGRTRIMKATTTTTNRNINNGGSNSNGVKIVHFIRNPFEMALSNYFYHAQDPTVSSIFLSRRATINMIIRCVRFFFQFGRTRTRPTRTNLTPFSSPRFCFPSVTADADHRMKNQKRTRARKRTKNNSSCRSIGKAREVGARRRSLHGGLRRRNIVVVVGTSDDRDEDEHHHGASRCIGRHV